MTSSALPIGEPTIVPGGLYTATIVGEVSEQTSKFDSSRHYYTLPLKLHSASGEEFDFTWAFGPKSPVYIKFLELIGGVATASGKVHPPDEYEGRTFTIKIGEQMNKEKTKTINSVLEVWPETRKGSKPVPPAEGEDVETPF